MNALDVLYAQLTRDLFATAKFLFVNVFNFTIINTFYSTT